MPHLSELQQRFADDGVTIIGVSKEDPSNSLDDVKEMTADKGDTMAYTVAWDDAGKTYSDYMTAAGQNGIPTSFLVDREGRIACIGHPMAMDIPMAMVVAGTWDPVKGPAEMKEMQSMMWDIMGSAQGASKEEAIKLLAKADEFAKRWPDQAGELDRARYTLLTAAERMDEAAVVGRRLVDKAVKAKDAMALNAIAWGIVDPEADPPSRDLGLALYAATVGCNLTGNEDPAILDTLARCHYLLGGLDRAIELEEKAVELATETNPRMAESLVATLDEYLAERD